MASTDKNHYTTPNRPESAQEIANSVLHTVFMGTENSSKATRTRAAALAQQIGAFHHSITIDAIVAAVLGVFKLVTGQTPKYISQVRPPHRPARIVGSLA